MKDFIVKYWLEFLLTGMGAIIIFMLKNHLNLAREDFNKRMDGKVDEKIDGNNEQLRKELKDEVMKSESDRKNMQCEIEALSSSVENLTTGVLSIQGRTFKDDCRALLKEGHVITIDEYEDIEEEFTAYHSLGGNHKGDALYKSVMKKWNAQITKDTGEDEEEN